MHALHCCRAPSNTHIQSLLKATGGAVVPLRPGDMLIMPPRLFHIARNLTSPTVSCNFSVCTMDVVPSVLFETLAWIAQRPQDVMHFDSDFARLLDDCTRAVLQEAPPGKASSMQGATSRGCLPDVRTSVSSATRLVTWYTTLQCIPKGWVTGFWGPLRDRLLSQLKAALPLHSSAPCRRGRLAAPAAAAAAGPAVERVAAEEGADRDGGSSRQRCCDDGNVGGMDTRRGSAAAAGGQEAAGTRGCNKPQPAEAAGQEQQQEQQEEGARSGGKTTRGATGAVVPGKRPKR
ncbi:hypothetical protein Agub_g12347 [Astrephomene gubernaculifera]|uniref:JmjC domain-containing protein n=1 Tax=Astrephomene gubernaculifera TaxID=47775 RepID=A0AAD3DY65_9CHLO|nr:hypothetical protein Agub_g12347 [Astrephomene gubernaculifera]